MNLSVLTLPQLALLIGVGLVVMIIIFVMVTLLISLITYEENPVQDRLQALKSTGSDFLARPRQGPYDELKEFTLGISAPISRKLYGENIKFQKQIKQQLTEAGLPDSEAAVWRFLSVQVAFGLICGAVLFPLSFLFLNNVTMNLAMGIGGLLVGRMLPQLMLKSKSGKRKDEIRYNLPDALDLMVVCVEAGLGLDATIQRVAEDMEKMAPDISHEFKRLQRELNAGVARMDAFQGLGSRSGVEELKSLCALIIQSDKLGTSIADTLRVCADEMRTRRRLRAEELASKASIKMTFPLVLLIFPPLFIVLLGPTAIQAFKTFMGNG